MDVALLTKYLIHSLFVHDKHAFFKAGYRVLYPECTKSGMSPWQHYVIYGHGKGFGNGSTPTDAVFFKEGYELEYPDVKAAGVDPWRHYAEKGIAEGRDNGLHPKDREFFAAGYLAMYPDVAKANADAWRHYVRFGKTEGRDNGLHPDEKTFFAAGYLEMYPDVAEAKIDPWRHYVLYGKKKGRDNGLHPNDHVFFADGYMAMYPDVEKVSVDPWRHYVMFGKAEGRDNGLHPDDKVFYAAGYLDLYPDVAKANADPWRHYVRYGQKEGRSNAVYRELSYITSPYKKRKNKFLLISYLDKSDGVAIWRIQFLKEFIEHNLSVKADIEYCNSFSDFLISRANESKCIIFSRPQNDKYFDAVYKYCRNNNVKLWADIDDLCLPSYGAFDSGRLKSKLYSEFSSQIEVERFKRGRAKHNLPMTLVDGVICSTKRIADLYGQCLNVVTHVHHNLISRKLFGEISNRINHIPSFQSRLFKRQEQFRLNILIASGSITHLFDFSTIFLELVAFLKKHTDVQLTILGRSLDESQFLKKSLATQLNVIPKVSFIEMLYVYSQCDILIVPLDLNVFNECKSNIKFIEAATVRKPCLARNIYEFSKDIIDKKNGLLYDDSDGFVRKLEWINKNVKYLPVLGEAAHKYVSENLTTDFTDQNDVELFADLLKD